METTSTDETTKQGRKIHVENSSIFRRIDVIISTWICLSKSMSFRRNFHEEFRSRIDDESTRMCPLGILMSFIDSNLTIIAWKERTFIIIFLNEWITYIIRTLNFQNTFSMAFATHNTVRRALFLSRNKPAFSNLNSMCLRLPSHKRPLKRCFRFLTPNLPGQGFSIWHLEIIFSKRVVRFWDAWSFLLCI